MIIADSHEFIELYRGDKDLRMGVEMLKQREDLRFVSFAPDRPSPNDAARFGIERTADGPVPSLPGSFDLRLLPSRALRFRKTESGGIVSLMPGLGRELRRLRPDVILENPFSWLTPRSYQTMWAARSMAVPVIYYDPGDDIPLSLKQRLLAPLERPVVNRAARIITYNEAGRRRFMRKYGYPSERIRVIPKPVDVAACRYEGDVRLLREELTGGHADALIVGYVGRLAKYKGSGVLLEVAERAMADPRLAGCRFAFIGGALASEENDSDYVRRNTHVTGMVAHGEVPRYIAACDVVVFPDLTHPGAFPTAVAEAMAAGRVLVAGLGDHRDYVPLVHAENALVVGPSDPEGIVAALRLLVAQEGLATALGASVGGFAAVEMDYPVVARRYLGIVDEVRGG